MKNIIFLILVIIFIGVSCSETITNNEVQSSLLKLDSFDYFEKDIPYRSTKFEVISNHDDIASLGRLLFYDARLSQNNSVSCGTCHQQNKGFSDNLKFSKGLKNYSTRRNTLSLVNTAYHTSNFWEGHEGDLDDHILNPISNHLEMGMRDIPDLVNKLSNTKGYPELFQEIYAAEISDSLIRLSLSSFVASIISYNSKFDKGKQLDYTNFSLSEKNGKDLFFGKAKCGNCHKGDHYSSSWRKRANIGLDLTYKDQGGGDGGFKIPSLRNIELTAPYMHDGRFSTLEEVINHYVNGIQDHPKLDWALRQKMELTSDEIHDVINFLKTLTDYELISNDKFSNPFL